MSSDIAFLFFCRGGIAFHALRLLFASQTKPPASETTAIMEAKHDRTDASFSDKAIPLEVLISAWEVSPTSEVIQNDSHKNTQKNQPNKWVTN
jgi:hypothetical protein